VMCQQDKSVLEPRFEDLAGCAVAPDQRAQDDVRVENDPHAGWGWLPISIGPEFVADHGAGFLDQRLHLDGGQVGVALLDVAHRRTQHLPSDGAFDEFRQVAFPAAMLGELRAYGNVGFLRNLYGPARQISHRGSWAYKRLSVCAVSNRTRREIPAAVCVTTCVMRKTPARSERRPADGRGYAKQIRSGRVREGHDGTDWRFLNELKRELKA
jgi:hypothetical protein